MARYRTGDHVYYRKGVHYPPGSVVEIPDNEKPSTSWTKLDDAATEPVAEEVVDNSPSTMSEITEQEGKRKKRLFANQEL